MKLTPELLRVKFQEGLERRTAELFTLIDAGDADGIYRAFHSLAGIGGTFGFPEVTALAREGEATRDRDRQRTLVRRIIATAAPR
ncbi:MAG TPA: Hpt domain-containing protein [Thermoanaerobaculia bacterium]